MGSIVELEVVEVSSLHAVERLFLDTFDMEGFNVTAAEGCLPTDKLLIIRATQAILDGRELELEGRMAPFNIHELALLVVHCCHLLLLLVRIQAIQHTLSLFTWHVCALRLFHVGGPTKFHRLHI